MKIIWTKSLMLNIVKLSQGCEFLPKLIPDPNRQLTGHWVGDNKSFIANWLDKRNGVCLLTMSLKVSYQIDKALDGSSLDEIVRILVMGFELWDSSYGIRVLRIENRYVLRFIVKKFIIDWKKVSYLYDSWQKDRVEVSNILAISFESKILRTFKVNSWSDSRNAKNQNVRKI